MTFYSVVNPPAMVNGQPEDISVVLANFQAVQSVINALTDDNIAPNAGIKLSKLESTSGTFGGVTFIGGNIQAPGYLHTGGDIISWFSNLPVGMGHLGPALQPGFRFQDDTYLYRTAAGELTTNILRATNLQERSEKGQPSGYASLDGSGKVPVAQIPDISSTYQVRSEKAAPNGYASLDSGGRVPVAQLPNLASTYQVVSEKGAASGYASLDSGTKVPVAQIPDLSSTYQARTEKATPNGYASLGSDGKVPTAQLPDLSVYQLRSEEGQVNGYASLDSSGKVPTAQLPASAPALATDPLWNAKGDLAVATANDIGTILPVGSNNQVLTADSAQATGVKWATPATAIPGHTIQDENAPVTQRANLDFQGTGVSVTDVAAQDRTAIIIPADGHTIYDETTPLPYQTRLAFVGAGVAVTNDSGAGRSVVTIPGVSYGTTLPASPVDGQEAILVDSLTNPSFHWRFRYNASNSNTYKWEFIGGAPKSNQYTGAAQGAAATAAWSQLTTNVEWAVPNAGEYLCRFGARVNAGAAAGYSSVGVMNASVGATGISPINSAYMQANESYSVFGETFITVVTAGQLLRIAVFSSVASIAYDNISLNIQPRKLS